MSYLSSLPEYLQIQDLYQIIVSFRIAPAAPGMQTRLAIKMDE